MSEANFSAYILEILNIFMPLFSGYHCIRYISIYLFNGGKKNPVKIFSFCEFWKVNIIISKYKTVCKQSYRQLQALLKDKSVNMENQRGNGVT